MPGYIPPTPEAFAAAFGTGPPMAGGAGLAGALPGLEEVYGLTGAATGGGGGLAGLAGSAGGAGGLLSRLGAVPAGVRSAGMFGAGGLARPLLGYGGAGLIGSSLIDKTNIGGQNSNWEQGLQGAALGAGAGAAIGSVVPVLGTGVGAAVGGLVGGGAGILANMFGGGGGGDKTEGKSTPIDLIQNMAGIAGLDPVATKNILDTYMITVALQGEDTPPEMIDAALAQAQQQVFQAMNTQQQTQVDSARALALQAQAADIFAPVSENILSSADTYAQTVNSLLPSLPAAYRPIAEAGVARETAAANRLASAYQAQAQVLPMADQLTRYQGDLSQLAQQQFAGAFSQQSSGGLADLLAASGV